jgi:hypothetical protein
MVLEVETRKQEVGIRDQEFRSMNNKIQNKVSGSQTRKSEAERHRQEPKLYTMSQEFIT